MLIKALASIEGSRKSQNPVIAPNSVFEADDNTAKRLLDMGAARKATKEDVALAKVHGLLLETDAESDASDADTKAESDASDADTKADTGKAADTKAATKPKTEAKTDAKADAKADDPL